MMTVMMTKINISYESLMNMEFHTMNADNISDIGKLIEILNEWEFKYEEEKRESKQGTIPQNPQYADIIKTIGNVGLSVPMGFVMVHNDLSNIYKLLSDAYSSKESKGTTSSSSCQ